MSETTRPPLSDYEEGLAQRLAALLVAAWRREVDAGVRAENSVGNDDLQRAEEQEHPTPTTDAA